ncbi:MAG: hypothetical protein J7K23_05940 [Thermoproteales archaeon]|nr:hypothetical protein [Thermoproteales archaeon]
MVNINDVKAKKLTLTAIFSAMAISLEILPIDIPFPMFSKLTIDITGVPLLLALYIIDLPSSIITTVTTGIIIALPRPPFKPSNPYGAFFKTLAELSTIIGVWMIKKLWKKDNKKFFIYSFLNGSFIRTIVMCIANYIFLPIFYGVPVKIVISILPIIALFNIVQTLVNILLAYLSYKAIKKRLSISI